MPPSPPPSPGKKSRSKKPVPKWQSWEKGALDRKFQVITGILVVLGVFILAGIGYLIHNSVAERSVTVETRSTVVNTRAPQFLHPFVCDLTKGFQSGEIRTFLKNVGNSTAANVASTFSLRLVPEKRVGIAEFDDIPSGNCGEKPVGLPKLSILAAREITRQLPQPVVALPPLLGGEGVQLYGVSCAFYSDGTSDRAACDTYRFRLAGGGAVFMCDGTPKTGKFDEASIANCGN